MALKYLLALSLLGGCLLGKTEAQAYSIIALDELTITYRNYGLLNDKARNLLLYPEAPKEALNLGIKTTVLTWGYWDSEVQSLTTDAQYRSIGLEMRVGVWLTDQFQLGLWHRSQHLLERSHSFVPRYPVEDAVELKIYLYREK